MIDMANAKIQVKCVKCKVHFEALVTDTAKILKCPKGCTTIVRQIADWERKFVEQHGEAAKTEEDDDEPKPA